MQLLQHVAQVAVHSLTGLADRWFLFFLGPLRNGVLLA